MDCSNVDARSLLYEMKNQDKELRRKRKWLMGLSAPGSCSRKRLKSNGSMLPETMLREDDLFYDSLKQHVEKNYGVYSEPTELATAHHVEPFLQHEMVKTVLALLNDLTNNGLYTLANLIGGGSILFEQTRWKMKKFITENIPKFSIKEDEVCKKLNQILQDPHNFKKKIIARSSLTSNMTIIPTKHSHHDAIETVLLQLKTMSIQTLCAMRRKLKGLKGSVPIIKTINSGWTKPRLAECVKSLTLKKLSRIDKWDDLPLSVMKAMDIGCLSLKLSNQSTFASLFCNYSPEIDSLQNELVKAIRLLKSKVKVPELKILKELLAPGTEYEVCNGGLRLAIKKMLTEYLFECSEMDKIPIDLLDILGVINRSALRQEEVNEEIESILNVSADVKQIFLDYLPDNELDLEFCDAYMENLQDSDDGELCDDEEEEEEELGKNSDSVLSEIGSTAEDSNCVDSIVAYCTPISNMKSVSECKTEIKIEPDDLLFTPFSYQTEKSSYMADTKDSVIRFMLSSNISDENEGRKHYQSSCKIEPPDFEDFKSGNTSTCRNKYLAVQQACDETSLVAYRLVGQILKGYADIEELDLNESQLSYLNDGNLSSVDIQDTILNEDLSKSADDVDTSIVIQAVQELIPSFTHSELEKVKKILR